MGDGAHVLGPSHVEHVSKTHPASGRCKPVRSLSRSAECFGSAAITEKASSW